MAGAQEAVSSYTGNHKGQLREDGEMKSFKNSKATRGCGRPWRRCTDCTQWEPIPFHNSGGVCMARVETPSRRLLTWDLPDLSPASAPWRIASVAVAVDRGR